ncbi:MAG TPA: PDZ domain-containing protein [Candidatus Acidoferrum sp.]|nr:PDZ domain-containing protein [Candidatus Acidoferrum sp.]
MTNRCGGCRAIALGFLLAFLFAARPAAATINYKVSLAHPEKHRFEVEMQVATQPPQQNLIVALPAWNALYQVRDFAYRVRDVRAILPGSDGSFFPARKIDKQTWLFPLSNTPGNVKIEYSIEWDEAGPFNSQLNLHHAFLNFAETLMYVPDRRSEAVEVAFTDVPASWRSIAELPPGATPNSFIAESYDKLVDAPVEIGKVEEFAFDNSGAHFRVVVDSKEWNRGALEDSLKRITAYDLKLMDGPPFKEYTFFFHIGPYPEVGGGGMEHSNCTAIGAGSVEMAVAIAAHEFFHAWNVKRIRPKSLEPVDYTKEQYSRALWFAEGVTSTYGSFALERSGIMSKEKWYEDLAQQICELQSRPARKWQSVEESSLDTWFDKYDAYNLPDRSISYYNKGQILGDLLDFAIRDATDNHRSLDDVLRSLNESAKQGNFYDESAGIGSVVRTISGKDFGDFFRRYVSGTDEFPYDEMLAPAGLALRTEVKRTADPGFYARRAASGITVFEVTPGGPAQQAGLRIDDVLLEANGSPVPARLSAWMRERSPGETLTLKIRRDGQEKEVSLTLASREETHCTVAEVAHPTEKQLRIRTGMLRGTTE